MKVKAGQDTGFCYDKNNKIVKKEKCEDAFCYGVDSKLNPNFFLAVVCDGIGSKHGSEKASEFVTNELNRFISYEMKNMQNYEHNDIIRKLEDKILEIANHSFWFTREEAIGTTLTLLFLTKEKYITINVGDSRIYIINNNEIKQITEDDKDENTGALTQCIGGRICPMVSLSINEGNLPNNFNFIICSDGVYKTLDENYLKNIVLNDKSLKNNIDEIIMQARNNKEYDDITLIIVKRKE